MENNHNVKNKQENILRLRTYPLGDVPILSQMSNISPQSSVVLFSLVAFSGNISKSDT